MFFLTRLAGNTLMLLYYRDERRFPNETICGYQMKYDLHATGHSRDSEAKQNWMLSRYGTAISLTAPAQISPRLEVVMN